MTSFSSGSFDSNRAILGPDDSMPSSIQIRAHRYHNQTPRFTSHSSDIDGDDDLEISDEQPPASAFYEANGLYISSNQYLLITLS